MNNYYMNEAMNDIYFNQITIDEMKSDIKDQYLIRQAKERHSNSVGHGNDYEYKGYEKAEKDISSGKNIKDLTVNKNGRSLRQQGNYADSANTNLTTQKYKRENLQNSNDRKREKKSVNESVDINIEEMLSFDEVADSDFDNLHSRASELQSRFKSKGEELRKMQARLEKRIDDLEKDNDYEEEDELLKQIRAVLAK